MPQEEASTCGNYDLTVRAAGFEPRSADFAAPLWPTRQSTLVPRSAPTPSEIGRQLPGSLAGQHAEPQVARRAGMRRVTPVYHRGSLSLPLAAYWPHR
jgi:hypothetical protein